MKRLEAMRFCPICSNILLVEPGQSSFRFCCQTCPYVSNITKKISKTMKLKRKEVDDVLGGDEAWAAANKTTSNCPYCDNREVRYMNVHNAGLSTLSGFEVSASTRELKLLVCLSHGLAPCVCVCPLSQAYFVQMQIRSADEPMTTFYKCTRCKNRWSGE